jgi:membrane-associated phospholipid phosphatase
MLVLITIPQLTFAQRINNSFYQNLKADLSFFSSEYLSPSEYSNWQISAFAGLTALFILDSDLEMHEEYGIEKEYNPIGIPRVMGNIGNFYDKPGTGYFMTGLLGSLYGGGYLFKDYKMKETAGLMTRALIISSAFTVAAKVLIGRARPYVENNPHKFRPLNFKFDADYMSMPSGHTSSIFALMTVLAQQYDSWYVKIPAYSFAVSVAVQRMNSSKHWASDLLVGGTLGYLVGKAVSSRTTLFNKSISFEPYINNNSFGLAFRF